jgi:hypothetical protein
LVLKFREKTGRGLISGLKKRSFCGEEKGYKKVRKKKMFSDNKSTKGNQIN